MIAATLRKARELIAAGWSEPFPRDKDGRACCSMDDGLHTIDVDSAIRLAAPNDTVAEQVLELLEDVACPRLAALDRAAVAIDAGAEFTDAEVAAIAAAAEPEWEGLFAWLEHPGRPLTHVLKLFDKALLRAKAQEAAHADSWH